MQLTWETFLRCIQDIAALSDRLRDGWVLHSSENEHESYLTKQKFLEGWNECVVIEYHVVFSLSYSTPLLCLNAWYQNGTLLTMNECWKRLNFSESEDMYSTLTQMDHPILLRPFLTLHPCRTAEILDSFSDSGNFVVSWLSVVGGAVQLDLDFEYASLTVDSLWMS